MDNFTNHKIIKNDLHSIRSAMSTISTMIDHYDDLLITDDQKQKIVCYAKRSFEFITQKIEKIETHLDEDLGEKK